MSSHQISFTIPPDFVWERSRPTLQNLACGFRGGWLDRAGVVSICTRHLAHGNNDPIIEELACILSDEMDRVDIIIERVAANCNSRENVEIWLYVILSWLYERRSKITNLFDVVEMIYSDFDYPEELEGFIPYMPLPHNAQPGEAGLLARMKTYLDERSSRFF